jgi:hypothetical protein
MKYKVENSKMPLQQNEQRHKQILAKYMPSSSNNSNIQYFHVQKSRCTSFLHKREETRRLPITTIGYG